MNKLFPCLFPKSEQDIIITPVSTPSIPNITKKKVELTFQEMIKTQEKK